MKKKFEASKRGLVMLRLTETKKLDIEFLKELTVNTKEYDIKNFLPEYLTRHNLTLLKVCVTSMHQQNITRRLQEIFPPARDDSDIFSSQSQSTQCTQRNKSVNPTSKFKIKLTECPETPPKPPSEFEILINQILAEIQEEGLKPVCERRKIPLNKKGGVDRRYKIGRTLYPRLEYAKLE